MLKQVALVGPALVDEPKVPVRGVLCFVDADWPLIGGAFTVNDVAVLWPKKLKALMTESGPVDRIRSPTCTGSCTRHFRVRSRLYQPSDSPAAVTAAGATGRGRRPEVAGSSPTPPTMATPTGLPRAPNR